MSTPYAYAQQNDDLETAFVVPMLEGDAAANCAASMKGNDDLTNYLNELIQKYIDDGIPCRNGMKKPLNFSFH